MATTSNPFGSQSTLKSLAGEVKYFRLDKLTEAGIGHLDKLPFSIKVLLESALRNMDGFAVTEKPM